MNNNERQRNRNVELSDCGRRAPSIRLCSFDQQTRHNGTALTHFLTELPRRLLILVAILVSGVGAAGANIGRIAATFHVDQYGAATYSIPIFAPRGPSDLQPELSLTYNSQDAASYVGVGWSISGISEIYRCNRTVAQDGSASNVALQTSDGYCLDGQRLRLISGTYGASGSVYETEIASFSQITAEGSAGAGPAYWEVQGKDGRTYEYGKAGGSQVVIGSSSTAYQWWLDKVTDRAGNTMIYSYSASNATGEVVPQTISWTPTGHGSTQYSYTINFNYTTNTHSAWLYAYVAGIQVSNKNQLQSIAVDYGSTTVKEYFLSDTVSPASGLELLTTVQECADSAKANCIGATSFSYQDGQVGVSTTATSAASGAASHVVAHYDFRGNGRDDLSYCNGGSANTIDVAFSNGSGYAAPINTGIACGALYGDLLGNGKDGILADHGGTWYYYTWNGTSFTGTSTGLAYDSSATQYVLADVNGDGLPDLIESKVSVGVGLTIYTRLNVSSGSTASFSTTNSVAYNDPDINITGAEIQGNTDSQYGNLSKLDFNGDGRSDLALEQQDTIYPRGGEVNTVDTYELISSGTTFTPVFITRDPQNAFTPVAFLNFNNDACTDYLVPGTATTYPMLYISGCNGTVASSIELAAGANVVGVMDWNGDGKDDILVQDGSTLGVYLSDGTLLSSLIQTSVPYSASDTYFTFDSTGGGEDLGAWNGSTLTYYSASSAGHPPDLLTKITDGYGNWTQPSYISLAQGAGTIYTAASSAPAGYKLYTDPMYVVSQTAYSDPSNPPNATYTRSDTYSGALESVNGRGFAGFAAHSVADSRTSASQSLTETKSFDQIFPYTGMVSSDVTKITQSGNTVTSVSNVLADKEISSTQDEQVWFPYASSATRKKYEVGGVENGALVSTTAASFGYDSYGNLTSSAQTTTDNDSASPYNGYSWTTSVATTPDVDVGTWCLALLTQKQITYSDTYDNSSVTRVQQFTPDLTNCRYTQVVTAPGSPYQVTENFGYDSFGNVNSDTVTGTGMSGRTTQTNWGSTGQFPMSVIDPTGAETQFNYDFEFGLVSSETNANNLQTSWAYGDGFGRVTQETLPDGTYTKWSYGTYSGSSAIPRMVITQQAYDTGGNLIRTTTQELDMLDRPYLEQTNLIDGSTATVMQRNYDSLGRVISEQEPYAGSAVGAVTYSYDARNRVTQMQHPISQSDGTMATTTYQYAGDTTTVTDANGRTTSLIHDVNGWLRETKDDLGYGVIFGYDAYGSRTAVTDNQGSTLWTGTWQYGIAPFLVGQTDMDSGAWGFTVDPLGERIAWTDPKGQQFFESYDALSRPRTRSEPDFFTQWTWGSSASSHNIGKLASVCSATGANPAACSNSGESETWSYDSDGRIEQRAITLPAMQTYTYTWQFSPTTGFLQTLTYPTGVSGKALTLQYAYAYGYLQSITDTLDSPSVVLWKADAMNPDGLITQDTLGNGIITTRAFDAVTHFLTLVQSGEGGGSGVQNLSFLYDPVGNLTQRQNNTLGLTENFYYDGDNRLSYSTLNGTQNLALTYNLMGDITNRTDVANNAAWTYDVTRKHEVTQAGSTAYQYAYDANGNMTSRQGSAITWTSYNYPSSIGDSSTGESVSFSYGPDRTPWVVTTTDSSGTKESYQLGSLMDMNVQSSGDIDRDYVYAGSDPVAVDELTQSADSIYYFQTDQQGSISGITNSAGQAVVSESFTAYGARRNPTTWSGAPSGSDLSTIAGITQRGYTFQRALGQQMGLNDMVGRVQDSVIGRFLSADPYVTDPVNTQDWNPYSYVYNNPMTYIDPSGFQEQCDGHHTDCPNSTIGFTVVMTGTRPPPPLPPPPLQNPFGIQPPVSGNSLTGASGLGVGGKGSANKQNQQSQGNQHTQCSQSNFAQIAQYLEDKGTQWMNYGETVSAAGALTFGTGAGIAQFGVTTADPVVAEYGTFVSGQGVAMASAGGIISLGGLLTKGAGAVFAIFAGNGQPARQTALELVQGLIDNRMGWPPGVPSPLAPVTNSLAGENPCP